MLYKTKAIKSHNRDPLLNFFTKIFNRPRNIISAIILIQLIVLLANYFLSYVIHSNSEVIRLFDPEYGQLETLTIYFVCIPFIWYVYLWQFKGFDDAVYSFDQNEIIGPDEENKFKILIGSMNETINSYTTIIIALIISMLFIFVFVLVVDPLQSKSMTNVPFWYFDKNYYYFIHIPDLFLFCFFPLLMIFIRFIDFVSFLNKVFSNLRIQIHPLHPDEAGGLGEIGHIIIIYGIFTMVLGIGMTILSILIRPFLTLDIILGYFLYFILISILLYIVMKVHNSMVQSRKDFLLEISKSFDLILFAKEKGSYSEELMSGLKESKKKSDLVKESYPVWPIPWKSFRISLLVANLPILIGLIDSFSRILI